jgi:hypothetical protein
VAGIFYVIFNCFIENIAPLRFLPLKNKVLRKAVYHKWLVISLD